MTEKGPTILFAGGGTGGHLFPAIAIAERLRALRPQSQVHFACSTRRIDHKILDEDGWLWSPLSVTGMPTHITGWPGFAVNYIRSRFESMRLLKQLKVDVVVSMGGFVSGPVVMTAVKRGIPVMLVNLDAVPGKANRMLSKRCKNVYSVFPTDRLGPFRQISMPLRSAALGACGQAEAREQLGFTPDKPLLLITGASQGAQTINQAMIELCSREAFADRLQSWQIMHLAGPGNTSDVEQAYLSRRLEATVLPFTEKMGLAWCAADLAISRAGAGSVAEVVANRTPTIFMPYPFHKDQHQMRNARPFTDKGGAILLEDVREPGPNADRLLEAMIPLIDEPDRRQALRDTLAKLDRGNSADELAACLLKLIRR